MRKHISTIILAVVFIVGIGMLIYPSFSDYWNSLHSSVAISDYTEAIAELDNESYEELWEAAERFNEKIYERHGIYALSDEELKEYNSLLNVSDNGVMGYIDIPSIKTKLVLYHGISETVLQVGAGHMEYTSLPVGGANCHSGISGHRGLVSAKLFTNLNKMVEGDIFMLHILDETLTYEVDQILIVEPEVTDPLLPAEGMDYCTLVTCTPYGINSHRLLVRGHRIDNIDDVSQRVSADAMQIEPLMVAPVVSAPMLLILLIYVFAKRR